MQLVLLLNLVGAKNGGRKTCKEASTLLRQEKMVVEDTGSENSREEDRFELYFRGRSKLRSQKRTSTLWRSR